MRTYGSRRFLAGAGALLAGLRAFGPEASYGAESINLSTVVSIEAKDYTPLFNRLEFAPGVSVTLVIDGTVWPYRRFEIHTECKKWVSTRPFGNGFCLGEGPVRRLVANDPAQAPSLPLLLRPVAANGSVLSPTRVCPQMVKSSQFSATDRDHIVANKVTFETALLLREPDKPEATPEDTCKAALEAEVGDPKSDLSYLAQSFQLHGYIADKTTNGVETRRNQCPGDGPGDCGTGTYLVRVVGVNSDRRFKAVSSALETRPVSAAQVRRTIDFWLRNDLVDGTVRPNADRLRRLSDALVKQANTFHRESVHAAERRAILELATELQPDNNTAQTALVETLVGQGNLLAADKVLQERLPKLREAYEAVNSGGADQTVSPEAYVEYASALVSASEVAEGRRGAVIVTDVKLAGNFAGSAVGVMKALAARKVNWQASGPQKADAQGLYLRALEKFAAVSQLWRTPASLDAAANALKEARTFYNRSERGVVVSLSGNGARALIATAPFSVRSAPQPNEPAGAPRLTVDIGLPPQDAGRVLAAFGDERVVASPAFDALRVWSEAFDDQLGREFGRDVLTQGRLSTIHYTPVRVVLGVASEAGIKFHEFSPATGMTTEIPGTVAASRDGALGLLEPDGTLHILKPGVQNWTKSRLKTLQGASELAISADGSLIAAVIPDGGTTRVVTVRPPDDTILATWDTGTGALTMGGLNGLALTDSGRTVLMKADVVCTAEPPGGTAPQRVPICTAHGIAKPSEHMLRPGLTLLGGETVGWAWSTDGSTGVRVIATDVGRWTADKPAPTTQAWREASVDARGRWVDGYLLRGSNSDLDGAFWRVRLVVPTIAADLRIVDLATLDRVSQNWSEAEFGGAGILDGQGESILVRDRPSGRLRRPGARVSVDDVAPDDRLEIPGEQKWVRFRRQSNLITGVSIETPSAPSKDISLPAQGAGFRHVSMPLRDHTTAQDTILLVRDKTTLVGGTRTDARILNLKTETVTQVEVKGVSADEVIGALGPRPDGSVVLIRRESGGPVSIVREDGTSIASSPVIGTDLASSPAEWADVITEMFYGSGRAFLRTVRRSTGKGQLVEIRNLDQTPPVVDIRRWVFDTRNVSTGAQRQGVGRAAYGFIDAETGFVALPGDGCMRVGAIAPPGSDEAWKERAKRLPSNAGLSHSLIVSSPWTLVGATEAMRVLERTDDRKAAELEPEPACGRTLPSFYTPDTTLMPASN